MVSEKKKSGHIIIVSLKAHNTPTLAPRNGTFVDSKIIFCRSIHVVLRGHVPTEMTPIFCLSFTLPRTNHRRLIIDIATSLQHCRHTKLAESAKFCATSWRTAGDKGYLPNNLRTLYIKLQYPATPSPEISGL